MPTVVDLLAKHFTGVERPPEPARQAFEAFAEFSLLVGASIQALAKSAPSIWYEPFLVGHGVKRIPARGLARLIVHKATRQKRDCDRHREVAGHLRFFETERRKGAVARRRARALLSAWNETSVIEEICDAAGIDVFKLIQHLENAVGGFEEFFGPLTEIVRLLEPHLSVRGPKPRVATFGHDVFLGEILPQFGIAPTYTENRSYRGQGSPPFSDAVTEATRREFSLKSFNPRPAYRWAKKKNP